MSTSQERNKQHHARNSRRIALGLVLLLVIGGVAYLIALTTGASELDVQLIKHQLMESCELCYVTAREVHSLIVEAGLDYYVFYLLLTGVLLLERFIPAKKPQRIFSVGLSHDFVWYLLDTFYLLFLFIFYWDFLVSLYTEHLDFLTIESVTAWPVPIQIVVTFLVSDLLHWLHHYLRHKVTLLWYFHIIHHSQRELNLFTDHRIHPVEHIIANTIRYLPFFSLQLDIALPSAVAWLLFTKWYTKLYHANVRSNYGLLRYILVTPQSHRIHHSIEEKHRDKNFGVIFSTWDHLFGTQYRNYDEYPDTGIYDYPDFPHETTVKGLSLVMTPIRQLIYPFRLILRNRTNRDTREGAV